MARARSIGVRAMRIYVGWDAVASGSSRPSNREPGDPAYRWGGIDVGCAPRSPRHGPILSLEDTPRWAERGGGGAAGNNPTPARRGVPPPRGSRYSAASRLPRVATSRPERAQLDGFFSPVADLYAASSTRWANA